MPKLIAVEDPARGSPDRRAVGASLEVAPRFAPKETRR
jgi:hypothetical protein